MALYKNIRQSDGVTTNYHRVLFIQITTNKRNSIAVMSYVDEYARAEELLNPELDLYRKAITYETDYDPTMTIESAYNFLKTLPEFDGVTDV